MHCRFVVLALAAVAGLALRPAAMAQGGQETVLTILHTNDPHGRVLSSTAMSASGAGGLARIATMVRQVRGEMPNVIFLEAGDVSQGEPTEYFTQATSAFNVMNAMGYDAMTLGNHEFDWGQDIAEENIALARFPVLAANVRDAATGAVFGGAREYVILVRGGVRVAVFGLTTLDTVPLQWPPTIHRIRMEDPHTTAARLVPVLRNQADVVVALSHLGHTQDQTLAQLPGLDLIIGGHSHTTLSQHVVVSNTLIAQTGSHARNLGRIDLHMARTATGWAIQSINGQGGWWADGSNPPLGKSYPRSALLPVPQSQTQDATVKVVYGPDWDAGVAALDEPLATALEDIPGQSATTVIRPLPVLLGDMIRRSTGADIAMIPGSVGPELRAGTVRFRDIFTLIGGYTRRNLVVVRVTEGDLRRLLAEVYRVAGQYPHYFSGIGGRIVRPAGGVSVEGLRVNGAPPPPGATYTLVAPSYLIMGNSTLRALPVVDDDAVGWMFERIAEGMRAAGVLIAPAHTLELVAPAPVTLAQDAPSGGWTLENGKLGVRIAADGRVSSLVKKTGAGAGADQARSDYRSFYDRVNRTAPSGAVLTPNPDGTDSDAGRSLPVEHDGGLGAGRFRIRKTYRLRRDLPVLDAELSVRNDTGAAWAPADLQDGMESIVYPVPGGSAPAGDEVRVKTVEGMDTVATGTHWWGAAPAGIEPRPEPAEGWLAAVDSASGVANVVTWDRATQKAFSRDGVGVLRLYVGVNRFQVQPLFTEIPAGQAVEWRQSILVDDGVEDLSFAAPDALIAGVTVSAEVFSGGSPAVALFRWNSTRSVPASYDLENVRLEAADGRRAMDLPGRVGVAVEAAARTAWVQGFPLDVRPGNYVLKADVVETGGDAPLTTLLSAPFAVGPPVSRSADVDGDGEVRPNDAALALRFAGGLEAPNDGHLVRGDMDADGRMTMGDAVEVMRRANGL